MKYIIVALLFVSCAVLADDVPPSVVSWSHTNVWFVEPPTGSGSGFWVDDETFFTACHVASTTVKDYGDDGKGNEVWHEEFVIHEKINIETYDGSQQMEMIVESCDVETDIAVLRSANGTKPRGVATTHIARSAPPQGTEVWGAGYGMGEYYIASGHWQSMSASKWTLGKYVVTVPSVFGDSGSPLFTETNGVVTVVGMRQALRSYAESTVIPHLTLTCPPEQLVDASA